MNAGAKNQRHGHSGNSHFFPAQNLMTRIGESIAATQDRLQISIPLQPYIKFSLGTVLTRTLADHMLIGPRYIVLCQGGHDESLST
jgi:hypothetical protein